MVTQHARFVAEWQQAAVVVACVLGAACWRRDLLEGGIPIMHKPRLLCAGFAVLCVLGGLVPCGAADQPDAPAAFRAMGGAQQVAMGTGNQPPGGSAGSPGSPPVGILDRAPGTVPAPPAGQVAQAAGASGTAGTAPAAAGAADGMPAIFCAIP